MALIHYFSLWEITNIESEAAISFFHTNLGLLVTMFTVTMAMTMLEIQFRAQSYTMLSIIQHVKDWVIYGFVSMMIMLIMFSTIILTTNMINPAHALPYAAMSTIFAIVYLAGYVYYMIGKAQPEHVMRDVVRDVINIKPHDIITHAQMDENKKLKIFHVWEHLMLRAVQTDNTYVFKAGIGPMSDVAISSIRDCAEDEKDKVGKLFFQHMLPVILSCVRADRDRFIRLFMDHFKKFSDPVPKNLSGYSARRLMMLHLWDHVMREAIIRGNLRIMRYGMLTINHMSTQYVKSQGMDARLFFHTYVRRLVEYAFANDSREFLGLYLNDWSKHYLSLRSETIPYQYTPLAIWEHITMHACKFGDSYMFGRAISGMRDVITKDDELVDSLTRISKIMLKSDNSFLLSMAFLDGTNNMAVFPTQSWKNIAWDALIDKNQTLLHAVISQKDAPEITLLSDALIQMRTGNIDEIIEKLRHVF